jgi:hypothetical protein
MRRDTVCTVRISWRVIVRNVTASAIVAALLVQAACKNEPLPRRFATAPSEAGATQPSASAAIGRDVRIGGGGECRARAEL